MIAMIHLDESRRTLGMFMDLCFEDIPQLYLPIWYLIISNQSQIWTIISLSGSILMTLVNIYIFVGYLKLDYFDAKQAETTLHAATSNSINMRPSQVGSMVTKEEFQQLKQRVTFLEDQMNGLLNRAISTTNDQAGDGVTNMYK